MLPVKHQKNRSKPRKGERRKNEWDRDLCLCLRPSITRWLTASLSSNLHSSLLHPPSPHLFELRLTVQLPPTTAYLLLNAFSPPWHAVTALASADINNTFTRTTGDVCRCAWWRIRDRCQHRSKVIPVKLSGNRKHDSPPCPETSSTVWHGIWENNYPLSLCRSQFYTCYFILGHN